jgi:O-methyltransferase
MRAADTESARRLYLDLLARCLTRSAFPERYRPYVPRRHRRLWRASILGANRLLARSNLELVRRFSIDPSEREQGRDHPPEAETMIGLRRLENLRLCVTDVLEHEVPGDLIETGVWRGGACIFMRGILRAYGDASRTVWVADSFQGLPKPDGARHPVDRGDRHWTKEQLAIPLEEVRANFARYGLLDEQVRFLVGWFSETLPTAPIDRLALLRLDGDMYGSTMDALRPLYPKLSKGGYLIVDDYGLEGCRRAVHDYREEQGITEQIRPIDELSAYWQKQS